jgi:hypothetical protein
MTILGLEHEYEVCRDGQPLDFRSLVAEVAIEGRRLDPADPFAHRMADGWVLTCDGAEAETVAPPVGLRPGFAGEVAAWAAAMAEHLEGRLGCAELRGVSTHISIEVPDDLTMTVCGLFARRFAAAVMLLADGPEGQGLLVRPRHRRVELGLGFTAGGWLRATTALATGAVLACTEVAAGRAPLRTLPRQVDPRYEGARARFGWYIDRRAYGPDLYGCGRTARLGRGLARRTTASRVLESGWACARQALVAHGVAASSDLVDADELASGQAPLHCEDAQATFPAITSARPTTSALGVLQDQRRCGFDVAPVAATWDFTVFALEGAARTLYVSVPRADHERFLSELGSGVLDEPVAAELDRAPRSRSLSTYGQATAGGHFDTVCIAALRPPERAYDGSFV